MGVDMDGPGLIAFLAERPPEPSPEMDAAVTAWLGDVDPVAWASANPPDHGRPWHSTVPGKAPGTVRVLADWSCDEKAVVALVRFVLPGWWWSVGHCSVSADSTLGPDVAGPDADLLRTADRSFDEGFRYDVRDGHVCLSTIENLVMAREARDAARASWAVDPRPDGDDPADRG